MIDASVVSISPTSRNAAASGSKTTAPLSDCVFSNEYVACNSVKSPRRLPSVRDAPLPLRLSRLTEPAVPTVRTKSSVVRKTRKPNVIGRPRNQRSRSRESDYWILINIACDQHSVRSTRGGFHATRRRIALPGRVAFQATLFRSGPALPAPESQAPAVSTSVSRTRAPLTGSRR